MPLGRSWLESLHFPRSHPPEVDGLMARWQTLQVPWPWLAATPSISGAHGESSSLRRKKGHCSGVVQVTVLGVREVPRLLWPRIHASCSGGPSLPIYGESSSEARSAGSALPQPVESPHTLLCAAHSAPPRGTPLQTLCLIRRLHAGCSRAWARPSPLCAHAGQGPDRAETWPTRGPHSHSQPAHI